MTFAEKLKEFNPSLYYAILDWKDKNLQNYEQVVDGMKPLHTLNEKYTIRLARTVIADTFELMTSKP